MDLSYPSLSDLISLSRERDKFIAFCSFGYAQEPVLLLCSIWDFEADAASSMEDARTIYNEYVSPEAPHSVALSASCRKGIEKKLKSKKVDRKMYRGAWAELEASLDVVRDYESHWLKERKVDLARRALVREIDFDLDKPPPLNDLLASEKRIKQLRQFAESVFCEEIVLFYSDVQPYLKKPSLTLGRDLCRRYIDTDAPLCLNLEYDTRRQVLLAFEKDDADVSASLFEECVSAMLHQMQQNLYHQFLMHLKAIRRELADQEEMHELRDNEVPSAELTFQAPSFDDVMSSPIQLLDLVSFAGRLYSQERLVFYILVDDFRAQPTDELRAQLARRIFLEYVQHNSKRQVSLEGRRYKRLAQGYDQLCEASSDELPRGIETSFFDSAQKEVARSIENEIFPRFVQDLEVRWRAQLESLSPRRPDPAASKPKGASKLLAWRKRSNQ